MVTERRISLRQDNVNKTAQIEIVITSEHSPNVFTNSTLSINVPYEQVIPIMDSIHKSATDFVESDKSNVQPQVNEDAERRIADMLK